jgi:hypothetical protein
MTRNSEIIRTKACLFGDSRQHPGADFIAIVECEDEVGKTRPLQDAM